MMNLNLANTQMTSSEQQQSTIRPQPSSVVFLRKTNNNNNNNAQSQFNYNQGASSTLKQDSYDNQLADEKNQCELSCDEEGGTAADAGTSDDTELKASRIRKRRYSMARIQPTRIKKVMQSDEDIGRMVASVPVAIGSAMELFAEKLLQGAAEALQHSSTKTLSPIHIKSAVLNTPHFAFLEPMLRDVQVQRPINPNINQGNNNG